LNNEIATTILKELKGINTRLGSMDKRLDGNGKRFDSMDKRFNRMDKKFDTIQLSVDSLSRSVAIMEHDHGLKIDLLLELYGENTKDHDAFNKRISDIEKAIEIHSFEIENLKQSS
jgi:archaellum component FlaC